MSKLTVETLTRRLDRVAKRLSRETGLRVTTSGLIRQVVKEFLRKKGKRI